MLTSRPLKTLLLDKAPPLVSLPAIVLLAVAVHPVAHSLQFVVQSLYPVHPEVAEMGKAIESYLSGLQNPWLPLLLIAVLPAICEELAFRGFILSGLRHTGHKWMAIALSAAFFGMAHSILQQSLMAALMGLVIGYVAVQTGSLVPCILFHMTHNGLMLLASKIELSPNLVERYPQLGWLVEITAEGGKTSHVYAWPAIIVGAMIAAYLLTWLHRLPYQKTAEEKLQEALQHQSAEATPA
jgi:sodium transport system permease protein